MKVKYFAWGRERIGKSEETVEPPANVRTIEDLIVAPLAERMAKNPNWRDATIVIGVAGEAGDIVV